MVLILTKNYAPEVRMGEEYRMEADICPLGVTLFQVCTLRKIKLVFKENVKNMDFQIDTDFYSAELQNLINEMIAFKQHERITLPEIQGNLQILSNFKLNYCISESNKKKSSQAANERNLKNNQTGENQNTCIY
jgi:hypothetical protein